MRLAEAFEKERGGARDARRVAIVEAHEGLHRQPLLAVRITQAPGHQFLFGKQKLVLAATRKLVHLKAHAPQKIIGLFEPQSLLAPQPVMLQHGVEVGVLEKDRARPADDLQIPQPANPFLDMRFEQIGGFTILAKPLLAILSKILQESATPL